MTEVTVDGLWPAGPPNPPGRPETIRMNVRWFDGYLETFEATEVRGGAYLLWMRLADGAERNIPLLAGVRWYSRSEESHEVRK